MTTLDTQAQPAPKVKLGRWSVVMALIALLFLLFAGFGLFGALDSFAPDAATFNEFVTTILSVWASRAFNTIGVILAAVGLIRGGPEIVVCIVGLVLNIGMLVFDERVGGVVLQLAAVMA